MRSSRGLLVSLAFVAVATVTVAWLYARLPPQLPVHWNLQGQPDACRSRAWGAALPVLFMAGWTLLTWLLPRMSPRGFEIDRFARVYVLLMLAVQAMLLVDQLVGLSAAAGYAVPARKVATLGLGALLMVLGNFMGKLRRNFFIGIRTPWTLASEAVWERTHRMGGWAFLVAGALVMIATALGAPHGVALVLVGAMALFCVLYSLWCYRRLERAP